MTTKEIILNYAVLKGGSFTRKDLLHDIADEVTGKNASALTLQINRLVTSGQLRRIGRGIYELSEKRFPNSCINHLISKNIFSQLLRRSSLFLKFVSGALKYFPLLCYTFLT